MIWGWSGCGAAKDFQALGRLAWLALACLAFLASDRPRSPCLHLATTARPPSAAGRRGAPLLLLLVQARRARPIRGEVSQASQGQPCKQPMCFGVGAVFFPEKCMSWKKVTCHLGIFGRFWIDFELNMFRGRNVCGNFGLGPKSEPEMGPSEPSRGIRRISIMVGETPRKVEGGPGGGQ